MIQITLDLPEHALTATGTATQDFAQELRLAAAVRCHELRRISQERANLARRALASWTEATGQVVGG